VFLNLMIIPSTGCPARCKYCFGPLNRGAVMGEDVLESTIGWLADLLDTRLVDRLEFVFHGGEPLTAGTDFYRRALPRLREILKPKNLKLNMQSNLWLLTDEFCQLFGEFGISLGTSLDGPEEITDAQRGRGYFRRTMAGIELARKQGLNVGCICTFTRQSAPQADKIMDFFVQEGLEISVHAAVPPLDGSCVDQQSGLSRRAIRETEADRWALSPEDYGGLLVQLLDSYLANLQRIRINTLDRLSRSVSCGEGGICTFSDCLGSYLAIAPDGGIYPCQRFAGLVSYRLGNVTSRPNLEQLTRTPVWQLFKEREGRLADECGGCPHYNICKGGCPYNALAAGCGPAGSSKDPYCPSYRRIFSHITERALEEVFADENMEAVAEQPGSGSLLRRGALLSIMRDDSRRRRS